MATGRRSDDVRRRCGDDVTGGSHVAALRVLLAIPTAFVAIAGCFVVVHLSGREAPDANRSSLPELNYLTETMLVQESAVPALEGTQWGSIVGAPQGEPAPVTPSECGLFLSQGDASQKGLAMRSSSGAAIGVELALDEQQVNLSGLVDRCASFTMDAPGIRSAVRLDGIDFGDTPDGAISTLMHSETTTDTQSVTWEIAMVVGYHRGMLVTAQYTPGPRGGVFDPQMASTLPDLYRAQVARLDGDF